MKRTAIIQRFVLQNTFSTDSSLRQYSKSQPSKNQDWKEVCTRPGGVTALADHLRILGKSKALFDGKQIHNEIQSLGIHRFTFVGNCLIEMYANCGSLVDARYAFDCLPNPNVYSWNMLIKAYVQNGSVDDAFAAFCAAPLKDTVSWNAIISGFIEHDLHLKALQLFHGMQESGFVPNKISFISALDASSNLVDLEEGQCVHAHAISIGYNSDVLVGTALLNMYGKCGCFEESVYVFKRLSNRDVICWNAMISIVSQLGSHKEALDYFHQMLISGFSPDHVSFVTLLECCTLEEGQVIHTAILEYSYVQDVEVCTALFNMYGKYGSLENALYIFDRMSNRNLVSWNSMICVFSRNNQHMDALNLFAEMCSEGFEPDTATFASILDTCASLATLEDGHCIHTLIIRSKKDNDVRVFNALISFYAACGGICEARKVFNRMVDRDVISWTAIITGSVQNGHNEEAIGLFHLMQIEGFEPDNITFVSILTACGRSGLVDEGMHLFISMKRDYGLTPSHEHYLCMIYLLGRAGCLDAAEELIENVSPDRGGTAWLSLLGACKIHLDMDRGLKAARNSSMFSPANTVSYVLLSNMYAEDNSPF